MTDILLFITI